MQARIKLEDTIFKQASDGEFTFRRLTWDDFDKGFLEVLKGLTKVGQIRKSDFKKRFEMMFPRL